MLARSPHLTALRELQIVGYLDAVGLETVIRNPTWKGLRKLDVCVQFWPERIGPPGGYDDSLELDELRLFVESYSPAQLTAFARSPLLKRLRHFALHGSGDAVAHIADAVDADRIETFAIGSWEISLDVAAFLDKRFGDRFRELP